MEGVAKWLTPPTFCFCFLGDRDCFDRFLIKERLANTFKGLKKGAHLWEAEQSTGSKKHCNYSGSQVC